MKHTQYTRDCGQFCKRHVMGKAEIWTSLHILSSAIELVLPSVPIVKTAWWFQSLWLFKFISTNSEYQLIY